MDPLPPLIPPIPAGPPITTPADKLHAYESMAESALHGTGVFYGTAVVLGQGLRPFKPDTANKLASTLTGFHFPHNAPAGRALPKPGPALLLYLAPAPIGVAPPEAYGLHPNFVANELGIEKDSTLGFLGQQIGFFGSATRVRYFDQRQADDVERFIAANLSNATTAQVQASYAEVTNPQFQADNPGLRAGTLEVIYRRELDRRGVVVTAPSPPAEWTGSGASFADLPPLMPALRPAPAPAPGPAVGNRALAPLAPAAPGGVPLGAGAVKPFLEVVNERTRDYLRSMGNNFGG